MNCLYTPRAFSYISSEGMALKLTSGIGLVLVVAFAVFVLVKLFKPSGSGASMSAMSGGSNMKGGSAKLPCLSNNQCPMGQTCANGFCSEGFMTPLTTSTDLSSCSAKECNGINAPCARRESPCGEGTFCQGNSCVSVAAPDQGEAYKQIGTLLD